MNDDKGWAVFSHDQEAKTVTVKLTRCPGTEDEWRAMLTCLKAACRAAFWPEKLEELQPWASRP